MMIRTLSSIVAALALLFASSCGGPADRSAPATTKEEPAPLSDPAKQQLLPKMSEVARSHTGGWGSLTPEQKAPFLDFHSNSEDKAKTHYETLVETEREVQKNLGQ